MMDMEFFKEWVGKKARISLAPNRYYKGLVLSVGEDFLKIKDFKGTTVFIKWENITIIEGWMG